MNFNYNSYTPSVVPKNFIAIGDSYRFIVELSNILGAYDEASAVSLRSGNFFRNYYWRQTIQMSRVLVFNQLLTYYHVMVRSLTNICRTPGSLSETGISSESEDMSTFRISPYKLQADNTYTIS